jgi:hypothetical protein
LKSFNNSATILDESENCMDEGAKMGDGKYRINLFSIENRFREIKKQFFWSA